VTSPAPTRYRFDAFELDASTGELRKAGVLLKLQPQPFRLLLLLVERATQLVTREEIQHCLWKDSTFVDFEHGINFSINQIRGALADNAEHARYIQTLPKRGYRFIGSIEQPPTPKQSLELAPELVAETPAPRRWFATVSLALVLAAIAGGAYFYFHRAPVLTERDTIVLADFSNSTGDAVFEGALRQGLSVQLEQSPFLSIVSDEQIQQTLSLMGQPAEAKLTPAIARELCQRTASAVVLDGSIARIGAQYLLTLKAVNCATGDSLASTGAQASDKDHVLDALGKIASEMRGKLGESHSKLAKFDTPLELATTPSLEALQALSMGSKALDTGDYNASAVAFHRAIALDPNFAAAYAGLSASYGNAGENSLSVANARKAFELRDRVSKRERFAIECLYYSEAQGDLEKARDILELWVQTYPRNPGPHFHLGNVYDGLGQYERGLTEAREAFRLQPASEMNRGYLAYSYLAVNRVNEAKIVLKAAPAKAPSVAFSDLLYVIAFFEKDSAGMAQQVARTVGKPGVEDVLFELEANTAAYSGHLRKSRELSRRAVASAEEAKKNETAASYEAEAALREALFGNEPEAQKLAAAALKRSAGRDVQYAAALTSAMAADSSKAQSLTDDLAKVFSENTIVRLNYLPTLRAQLALSHQDAAKAIDDLSVAVPYDLMTPANPALAAELYPVFVRGQACLAAHQSSEAAREFQKILDHSGIVVNAPIGALAHLGLARAYVLQGGSPKARTAYQDFLTLWKDADPDIPVLKQAKAEYAKLQ
jgi:eukaryotic-like serine/threonine-protein kinase